MTGAPSSPFKGLNAFADSELDALLFFGREREREIVVANLIASRLTVLYGPSGVGKSSLLSAAVARSLRELPEKPLVVVFSRWSDDPSGALSQAVAEATCGAVNGSALGALEDAQDGRDVYLVLDQTEEYFLYHADDGGPGSFAEVLPGVLAAPLRINVLVSLREDSLAKLDRFTGRVPGLFANTLRLDRLDRQAAKAAIIGPIDRYGELTGTAVTIEPDLIERVLDEVGAGQIEPALGGLGAVEGSESGALIEAPYLQLVMQRLWEEEQSAGSLVFRHETLERLGGAQHIVEEHLESAMNALSAEQKDVAGRLFNHLVTPSGTKIAHEVSDLADFGQVPTGELEPVLSTLSERRILRSLEERGSVRYEIFHDVLAQPVLAWRARHRTEREIERQLAESHGRRRRLQLLFGLVLVALALMASVTAFALSQRSEAREQAREAKARELEALARGAFDIDPERGLVFALEAALLSPTPSSEETLRDALQASRVLSIVRFDEPVKAASQLRGDVIGATAGGSVVKADSSNNRTREEIETGVEATRASFSDGGSALLTGADGRLRLVRPDGSVVDVPGVSGSRGAELSADGKLAVSIDETGTHLIEVDSGRLRQFFDRPGTLSATVSRDGALVATGHAAKVVRTWDVQTGARLRKLFGHVGGVVAVALSPRGDLVASASRDGTARVWRVADGQLVAVLTGHGNALTDIDFSPDGTQVVTASKDRTARVWKVDTGALLIVLRGHRDVVTSAAFGRTGRNVVTASADGTARVWDGVVQPELEVLATLPAPVKEVVAAGDGYRVVAADDRTHVLDPVTGEERRSGPAGPRTTTVAGPDATATIRGNSVVVRTDRGTTVLKGHGDRVTSASFSADGTLLVTASRDREARVWDLATGNSIVLQGHFGPVQDARFSPDARWVVTAGPGRAGLWDARTGALVELLRGHKGRLTSAGFDSTGRVIVTGGEDGTVRTYRCLTCGDSDELVKLAERRLAATGRELTPAERER